MCPDYSFNYGKRHAPTAGEIVSYLEDAQDRHGEVGLQQLMKKDAALKNDPSHAYPINAGVSCLAALPSDVREIVPEPYRYLDTESVEKFYGECMDPTDNVFDMKRFERLCDGRVAELGYTNNSNNGSASSEMSDKQKVDKSHYWIVLAKSKGPLKRPIDPPPPFSERLSELRPNNRISVKRIKAVWEQRSRSVWEGNKHQEGTDEQVLDSFLSSFESLNDVQYKSAYRKGRRKHVNVKEKNGKQEVKDNSLANTISTPPQKKKKKRSATVTERMLSFKVTLPPKKPRTTTDGHSAVACLKQLQDAGFIGETEWTKTTPSPTSYASFDPDGHELVRLRVDKNFDSDLNVLKEAIVFEQDRDVNQDSRQAIRHHLAHFALCAIIGSELKWTNCSFIELRDCIAKKHNLGIAK